MWANEYMGSTDSIDPFISEREARKQPTQKHYAETRRLFRDFCITVGSIPAFPSVSELFKWRTEQINKRLA